MNLTVDTNILVKAFLKSEQDHLHLTTAVGRNGLKLCCDFPPDSVIVKEYERNIGDNLFYRKWFNRLHQVQAIHYCNGRLPKKHLRKLKDFQCHEPSDHVFIGVAFNSDKILISEDSDVGKGPKGNLRPHSDALNYLNEKMAVNVYDASEACEFLSQISTDINQYG